MDKFITFIKGVFIFFSVLIFIIIIFLMGLSFYNKKTKSRKDTQREIAEGHFSVF